MTIGSFHVRDAEDTRLLSPFPPASPRPPPPLSSPLHPRIPTTAFFPTSGINHPEGIDGHNRRSELPNSANLIKTTTCRSMSADPRLSRLKAAGRSSTDIHVRSRSGSADKRRQTERQSDRQPPKQTRCTLKRHLVVVDTHSLQYKARVHVLCLLHTYRLRFDDKGKESAIGCPVQRCNRPKTGETPAFCPTVSSPSFSSARPC